VLSKSIGRTIAIVIAVFIVGTPLSIVESILEKVSDWRLEHYFVFISAILGLTSIFPFTLI
jgi:hypothetical protein